MSDVVEWLIKIKTYFLQHNSWAEQVGTLPMRWAMSCQLWKLGVEYMEVHCTVLSIYVYV